MKKAPLRFDFHLHTLDDPLDHHVYHTAYELIDKAARLGLNALAITLHEAQLEHPSITAYAEKKGILLLSGLEQNIEGVHVLLINFEREEAENIRTFSDLATAKQAHHLVIAPHPYFPGSICLGALLEKHASLFDAVEISGFYHRWWNPNLKAMRVAGRLEKPLVGHSDTHTLEQLGTTFSEVTCEANAFDLVSAIKAGEAKVVSRPLSLWEMLLIGWKAVGRSYMPGLDYKKERGYQPLWPPKTLSEIPASTRKLIPTLAQKKS